METLKEYTGKRPFPTDAGTLPELVRQKQIRSWLYDSFGVVASGMYTSGLAGSGLGVNHFYVVARKVLIPQVIKMIQAEGFGFPPESYGWNAPDEVELPGGVYAYAWTCRDNCN